MEEKRKPRRWGRWLVLGLVLLVAYPLSLGPVVWLEHRGYSNPTLIRARQLLYHPAREINTRFAPAPFRDLWGSYVRWWH